MSFLKQISFSYIILTSVQFSYGQLDPRFSQNIYLSSYYNPGSVGFNEQVKLISANRSQWVGIDTYFTTNFVNAQWQLKTQPIGMSASFTIDHQGTNHFLRANYMANYRIQMAKGIISFGLSTGILRFNQNYSNLLIKDPNDQILITDPKTSLDLGFGVMYQSKNYQIGFSSNHLNQPKLNSNRYSNLRFSRNYYLHGSLKIDSKIGELYPSFLSRFTSTKTFQSDLSITNIFKNNLIFGLSGRTNSEFSIICGYTFDNQIPNSNSLTITYSYENVLKGSIAQLSSSHEIILQLLVGKRPNPDMIRKKRTQLSPIFF